MSLTQRHILLLTQQAELEAKFRSAVHDARLHIINAANGDALGPRLRRGVNLVAFDMELPPDVLAAGVAALDEHREVPVLGLGDAGESWDRLLWGSPLKDHVAVPFEAAVLRWHLDHLLERGDFLQGSELVGQSSLMRQLRERILIVAPTPVSSILLTGESGAGKDLVAEALHRYSSRREHPFRPLNCGAIPENLLENELFGHEKGAFTDARAQYRGIFEQADGGTVFLDEIGEMSPAAQVRLLRVLEQREVVRIGGSAPVSVDIRVIAATNRDPQKAVDQREFRLDLYHRLKVVELDIPPLRRRAEDIPLLIEHFTNELTQDNKSRIEGFSAEAIDLLQSYAWPGNVRELRNLIEHLVFLAPRALVEPEDLLPHLRSQPTRHLPVPTNKTPDQSERELIYFALLDLKREVAELRATVERNTPPPAVVQPVAPEESSQSIYPVDDAPYNPADPQRPTAIHVPENAAIEPLPTLKDREREAIEQALDRVGGNRRKAAAILGISTRTLYRKLKEYDLE